jgi:hypothetical protein
MSKTLAMFMKATLLASFLASSIVIPAAFTHSAQGMEKHEAAPPAASSPAASPVPASAPPPPPSPSIPVDSRSPRQAMMYRRLWGIDDIQVRATASGSLIRFGYRVVDATRAKPLNDERAAPYMLDMRTGAKLEVPETEMMGKLRQVAPPQNGREYWMVFLNARRFVKPGSRVSVVIGKFRADGLVVEAPQLTVPVEKP